MHRRRNERVASAPPVCLSGRDLTIDQIEAIVCRAGARVTLADGSLADMRRSHQFLQGRLRQEVIYGVNTGFGPMARHVLGHPQLVELQYNLIRSHAVGIGDPVEPRFVLAAMIARLNALARGTSGVSESLARALERFVNLRIIPVVPEHGAVGASGDLVQLAHIGAAIIGEGDVFYRGRRSRAGAVLRRLGFRPHRLGPKEGLSLINGTSFMTGIAALLCADAGRLVDLATQLGALAMEVVGAFDDGMGAPLSALRPHPGQVAVAARLRALLQSSTRLRDRRATLGRTAVTTEPRDLDAPVQEVYSIRCLPQILGPVYDTVTAVARTVGTELNSVTDNPIVLWKQRRVIHGGNFHGDYIASGMDRLKTAMVKLTMLSERRINFCLSPHVNRLFPPFLNLGTLGLNLGLQGLQFVATSATAQSQTLSFPQHLHSIPCNGDNQDVVSMGTDAALLTHKVIENAFVVAGVEAVVLAQAVDHLGTADGLSESSRRLYQRVRTVCPVIRKDRFMDHQMEAVRRAVRQRPADV